MEVYDTMLLLCMFEFSIMKIFFTQKKKKIKPEEKIKQSWRMKERDNHRHIESLPNLGKPA